jgi:uncharacterized membrane protein YedE/YeeE
MLEFIKQPWPWYVAGPLIGLTVPVLLILGNKNFGISSSLRHVCAACMPAKVPFFDYDWKKEVWNLFFVFGIFVGGILATQLLASSVPVKVHPDLVKDLTKYLWSLVVFWLVLELDMRADVLVDIRLWDFQVYNGLPWLLRVALWQEE